MKADYDSEANALSIDFFEPDRVDRVEKVGGSACLVWLRDGRPFSVEVLNPGEHLDRLDMAARRFGLNPTALSAAAHAALAAPDHVVTIDVTAAVPA